MCGIVGCIGEREAYPVPIRTRRQLECRGYGSAGVALVDQKRKIINRIAHFDWGMHKELFQANVLFTFSFFHYPAFIYSGIVNIYAIFKIQLPHKDFTFKSSTNSDPFIRFIEYSPISDNFP